MFGIKINWDVLKEHILADLTRNRTGLERAANVAIFVIGWVIGWKIGVWFLESLGW